MKARIPSSSLIVIFTSLSNERIDAKVRCFDEQNRCANMVEDVEKDFLITSSIPIRYVSRLNLLAIS